MLQPFRFFSLNQFLSFTHSQSCVRPPNNNLYDSSTILYKHKPTIRPVVEPGTWNWNRATGVFLSTIAANSCSFPIGYPSQLLAGPLHQIPLRQLSIYTRRIRLSIEHLPDSATLPTLLTTVASCHAPHCQILFVAATELALPHLSSNKRQQQGPQQRPNNNIWPRVNQHTTQPTRQQPAYLALFSIITSTTSALHPDTSHYALVALRQR